LKIVGKVLVAFVAIIAIGLAFLGAVFPIQILYYVGVGWIHFLFRIILKVNVDSTGLATALVCLVGLILGLQIFLSWLYQAILNRRVPLEEEAQRRWPFRWTFYLVALMVLMFTAGIAAIGFTHQSSWLLKANPVRGGIREVANKMSS